MIREMLKPVLRAMNIDYRKVLDRFNMFSIAMSVKENGMSSLVDRLRAIVPDISAQEESEREVFNEYWGFKRRALQAFQCTLMLKALEDIPKRDVTVVDIGDSAGTHMLYLKKLTEERLNLDTIGVNLDPRAVKKIEARGLKAILCRAEELELDGKQVDLFTSFEMVEHLHNPALFFYRLAKRSGRERFVITVPYLRQSRMGLHHARKPISGKTIYAEDEHIFELSPKDWELLMLHSGWRISYSRIYYQYPKKLPLLSSLLGSYWRRSDFEGFWGAILEKDMSVCDNYNDWEKR